MIISDLFGVLPQLLEHPNIDSNNIGFIGTSLGAAASLYSAWNPELIHKIYDVNPNIIKLHVALYPPCLFTPKINRWTNNTIITIIGTADRWTKPDTCVDLFGLIYTGTGYTKLNKKLYLYTNEHHIFDSPFTPVTDLQNIMDFSNCTVYIDEEGRTISTDEGIHMGNKENREYVLKKCTNLQTHPIGHTNKQFQEHAVNTIMMEIVNTFRT
jgi:hypothetical protein